MAERLTLCGLEVEEIETFESVKGGLKGLVVGHVISAQQHPNADRLRVCKVEIGNNEPLQIVCGASNVAEGQKVAVALVGTTLYPNAGEPITLSKSKIRGEVSEGMICAEDEMGIGESHAGILVLDPQLAPGTPISEVFNIESDAILTIGLTANRADAASHFGVARDVAALTGKKAILPVVAPILDQKNPVSLHLPEPERCGRYIGILIQDVNVGPSPDWLKNRLLSIGARPINVVVDVTNYVLHETGQPLHAFDADSIKGNKIEVKTFDKDFTFTTLDNQERKMLANIDLMICDAERPLAIAGVMGGANSAITEQSKNILLESAWFGSAGIRKTSRRLGLISDASYRFERGVDPNITEYAAKRATQLLLELCGGKASALVESHPKKIHPHTLSFDVKRANKIMGRDFSVDEIKSILESLEIEVKEKEKGILELSIPPYRVDVTRPQDVMEEILRIFGQNNIHTDGQNRFRTGQDYITPKWELKRSLAERLAGAGWREIVVNSLVNRSWQSDNTANLINNLSEDMAVLRNEMLIPVMEIIAHNHNRKQTDLRLFEFGKQYQKVNGKFTEKEMLALYLTGNQSRPNWLDKQKESSFFDLSGRLETIEAWLGIKLDWSEIENHPWLEYGMQATLNGKVVGYMGAAKTDILLKNEVKTAVFYAAMDWNALSKVALGVKVKFSEVPKFPSIQRDISMIVPESVKYGIIREAIIKVSPKLIREVGIRDVYKGDTIEKGQKSYLINLILLDPDKTLTDEVADKAMNRVYQVLEAIPGLLLRK